MDMIGIRRRVLMSSGKKLIDTSPKIAEYGYFMRNSTVNVEDADWCITEYMDVIDTPLSNACYMVDANASQFGSPSKVYRFYYDDDVIDYWYGSADFSEFTRQMGRTGHQIMKIAWSLRIDHLDDCYAYLRNTGQIFFAGKNSPYYGYTNINDMPT